MDDIAANRRKTQPAESTRTIDISLRQLQVFWAIAHSDTLTRAAKQLGLAQPSLSQQLSRLESAAGTQLFHRRSGEMVLTEAGRDMLPKAGQVLRNMQDLEDGLRQFAAGQRVTVRIAGITSLLRMLLPQALTATREDFPGVEFDLQEAAPNDIVEMLHSRRVHIGLLAANSLPDGGVDFLQMPLVEDSYALVVPERLALENVTDPVTDLDPADLALLSRYVRFSFGTPHAKRVEDWYVEMLPGSRVVAQCRGFEMAIELVKAELGVCLAPALSSVSGGAWPEGVRVYRLGLPPRRLVALLPSQYRRQEPFATLLDRIAETAAQFSPPPMLPPPPFLAVAADLSV